MHGEKCTSKVSMRDGGGGIVRVLPPGSAHCRRAGGLWRPTDFKYTRIDVHYVLERVMHVERSAMCMDAQRKRHPCVRRDPDPGAAWIPRARNDHHAVSVGMFTLQSTYTL